MNKFVNQLRSASNKFYKIAQELDAPIQLDTSTRHKPTFTESNEFAVIAIDRLFNNPNAMKIGDWVHNADKSLLNAPKQFFTEMPVLFEVGSDYVAFLIAADKVLRVGLVDDAGAGNHGSLGNFDGHDLFWSVVNKQKPTGTTISAETEKAVRFIVRDVAFELSSTKKKDLENIRGSKDPSAISSLGQVLVDVVKHDFPNGVEEIEASVMLNDDWLQKLCETMIQKALNNQISGLINSQGLKVSVDGGYLKF